MSKDRIKTSGTHTPMRGLRHEKTNELPLRFGIFFTAMFQ